MKEDDYQRMVRMMEGKETRDQQWLDSLAMDRAEQNNAQKGASMSPVEMELFQRAYDRRMFGPEAERRYARDVPGLEGFAKTEKKESNLKGHSSGRLKIQYHSGGHEVRQVLKLYRE